MLIFFHNNFTCLYSSEFETINDLFFVLIWEFLKKFATLNSIESLIS